MSKRNDAKLLAFQKVSIVLKEKEAFFSGYVALNERIATFEEKLTKLLTQRASKGGGTEGLTDEKQKVREQMITQALSISKKTYVWAKGAGKTEYLPDLDLVKTDFDGQVLDAINLASKVENIARENLASLADYRVDATGIDKLKDSISNLEQTNPKPLQKRGQNRAEREAYAQNIREQDEVLDEVVDLIVGDYLETNPDVVNSVLAARRIDDPATRSTEVLVEVSDAEGQPIDGALCDITQIADEEQYTDLEGKATLTGIRPGMFTFEISKEGYATWSQTITIKRGQKLRFVVKLGKA